MNITSRLRCSQALLAQEAAAEIERLREALEELRAAADQADAEYRAEIDRLRLTDAEREAIAYVGTGGPDAIDATLRGLLDRLSPIAKGDNDRPEAIASDYPDQDNAPKQDTTPAQGSVPPEWMSRPYLVDPSEGWRYGFPRLYDPATDGNMAEWLIRCGYPEHLARQNLPCTLRAKRLGGGGTRRM